MPKTPKAPGRKGKTPKKGRPARTKRGGPSKTLASIKPGEQGEPINVVMVVQKSDGDIVIKRSTRSGIIALQHD